MVYTKESSSSPYINIKSSFKNGSKDERIIALQDYLSKLDGNPDAFENIQPVMSKIFHPEFKIVSNGEEMDYQEFVNLERDKYTRNGCIAKLENVQANSDGTVTIVVNNILPGEDGDVTEQTLSYKDGRIVRCEAVSDDAAKFGGMIGRVSGLPADDDRIRILQDYLSKLDGSPNAFANVKPILSTVFHPEFKLVSGGKEMDYNEFVILLEDKYSYNGCIAKLEHVSENSTDGTLSIVVNNILPGEVGDATEQILTYKDGKVVRCEAASGDTTKFAELVDRVSALPAQDRVRVLQYYFSKLDGTSSFDNVEPIMSKIFHPEFKIVSNGEEMDYPEFVNLLKDKYTRNGCIANLESVQENSNGTVTIVVNNILPGENGDVTEQTLHYKDGRIVRCEAVSNDEAKFGAMIGRVSALPGTVGVVYEAYAGTVSRDDDDVVVEKFKTMMHTFDGSPGSFERAKPLMDDLFDIDNFVARTNQGKMDYDWVLSLTSSLSEKRSIVKVEEAEMTDAYNLRAVIHVIVDGKDMGRGGRRMILKDGKIVLFEAGEGSEDHLNSVIDRVMSSDDKQIGLVPPSLL